MYFPLVCKHFFAGVSVAPFDWPWDTINSLARIKTSADDPTRVRSLSQEAQQIIRKRQKLIKIADR